MSSNYHRNNEIDTYNLVTYGSHSSTCDMKVVGMSDDIHMREFIALLRRALKSRKYLREVNIDKFLAVIFGFPQFTAITLNQFCHGVFMMVS